MLDTPRSVSEVTDRIRTLLGSDATLADLWVTGEVLEATVSRSGHVFFTLSDGDSRLRCVLFRMNALRQRSLPSPGSSCVAHGRIEFYPADSAVNLYVDLVEEAGIGLAALELELLRQQLEAEGLFDLSRKRPLPRNPRTIGVVTSESGAVWHDIQHVVRRRFPLTTLILSPSSVQGESAPSDLRNALRNLLEDGRVEVIVVARGGGSASDLAAFNDEALLRAVFASPVPVVSAVGHETDWTLLDLVADVRAPTPSAAAELVTPEIGVDLSRSTESLAAHFARFERGLASRFLDLERLTAWLDRSGPPGRIRDAKTRLVALESSIRAAATGRVTSDRDRLLLARSAIERGGASALAVRAERARHTQDLLTALSPARTMARGYAFVEDADTGRPILSLDQIDIDRRLRTHLGDGSFESRVSGIVATSS